MPSFLRYKTFSLAFLKSSFVTFMRRSRSASKPASVQIACKYTNNKEHYTCVLRQLTVIPRANVRNHRMVTSSINTPTEIVCSRTNQNDCEVTTVQGVSHQLNGLIEFCDKPHSSCVTTRKEGR